MIIDKMDFVNLLIGILLFFLGIILYSFERRNVKKEDKNDYMLKSFNIEIFFGIFVLIITGIVLIFKELKNLF